jgi:hypothetical protein
MREQLIELSKALEELDEKKDFYRIAKEQFEKRMLTTIEEIKAINEQVEKIKGEISEEVLANYKKTGEKKHLGGVGVRVKKITTQTIDEGKALEFAKEKGMFLQLDRKALEAAAPGLDVDFIEISTEEKAIVTFPKEIKLQEGE